MSSATIARIFRENIKEYSQGHRLSAKQWKVVNAIMNCRTAALGGHLYECRSCGGERPCYNPCRDRHCPNCQYILKEKWVKERLKELLPVPYYHVVFTLPHSLNDLISYNKRLLYNLFFCCVKETLNTFANDPNYLGAQCGYLALLHTWGQGLSQHVHLHLIVAGGGIAKTGEWKSLPYESRFLFPVRAVGKMFRGKFISKLKKMHYKRELVIPECVGLYKEAHVFEHMLDSIAHKKWRVYAKKPFGSAEMVVRYIGRYSHRVAISNKRIIDGTEKKVRFNYKDYKQGSEGGAFNKEMTLPAAEFIRRFLLHILPHGFNKIRFYGFWAGKVKKDILQRIRSDMGDTTNNGALCDEQEEVNLYSCPHCKVAMFFRMMLDPQYDQVAYVDTS
ncbi:MAG: IS91 family transposase [Calditrichaeota bacterium]|nr:MAG: IS91 family transposase [Calditrichota bacterium]KAA3617862.1 MAG: IS91 family transposase [Calditrichota bacterium]MBL1203760.1 IS91 family transposase [Calditrichota bacterium]MBL1203768.1 IS91 family transposase [Calditrichota bacterium]NOG43590.1 IS91 family transposase [Calditrichota bacterium]